MATKTLIKTLRNETQYKQTRHTEFIEELADWFIKQGVSEFLDKKQIAKEMIRLRKAIFDDRDYNPSYSQLSNAVRKVRFFLELNQSKTLLSNMKGGYRLATDREATYWAIDTFKKFIRQAGRVQLRQDLVRQRYLKIAIEEAVSNDKPMLDALVERNKLLLASE